MSYTPEQIAEEIKEAHKRKLFPQDENRKALIAIIEQQRGELFSEKLKNMNYINERDAAEEKWNDALAKIARMEELHSAENEQQREQIDDLSGKLDYAFIAADRAEQELLAQRERITALEERIADGLRATNFCFPEDLDAYGSAHDAFYEGQRLVRGALKPRNEENPT